MTDGTERLAIVVRCDGMDPRLQGEMRIRLDYWRAASAADRAATLARLGGVLDDVARVATERAGAQERTERNPLVLIWSDRHQAWWWHGGCGFTTDRDQAGRWLLGEARRLVGDFEGLRFHLAERQEVEVR